MVHAGARRRTGLLVFPRIDRRRKKV